MTHPPENASAMKMFLTTLIIEHIFKGTAYSLPSARLLSQIITDKHIKLGQCKKNQVVKENMNFCFDPLYADPARFGTKFLTNVRRMFK